MSNILDNVFAEVCLDERVSDGIFRMDETGHMDALRDYFVKRGIAKESAIHITNRMVEGKYPDRQAYRAEDGILVTWPSPKHKQKSMRENPGKYVEQNPFPKKEEPREPREPADRDPHKDSEKSSPNVKPVEEPSTDRQPSSDNRPGSNLFTQEPPVKQGDKQLSVEPIPGTPAAQAPQLPPQPIQKTPAQIAAEKEVVNQIIKQDDDGLTNIEIPINEIHRQKILVELYKKADALGLSEVSAFLIQYIK